MYAWSVFDDNVTGDTRTLGNVDNTKTLLFRMDIFDYDCYNNVGEQE
jgi:hypothetical protein